MVEQNCNGCKFERPDQTKCGYWGDKPQMLVCNEYTKREKKLSVSLYDEDGNQRNPLEILKEVQTELERPAIKGGTFVLDEDELEETQLEGPEAEKFTKNYLWQTENMNENGDIEVRPVNSDKITIHGEEMLWFFICRLLDCNQ